LLQRTAGKSINRNRGFSAIADRVSYLLFPFVVYQRSIVFCLKSTNLHNCVIKHTL